VARIALACATLTVVACAAAHARAAQTRVAHVATQRPPLQFIWPTSIDLQPDGSLLVVENGAGRVDRVRPATGDVSFVVSGLAKPYAAVRTRSGKLYVSNGTRLLRDGKTIATAGDNIGPIAVAANGTVFYTTQTKAFQLGRSTPIATKLAGPHGIAFAADGSILVCDTGHDRVLRIDHGTVSTLIRVGQPRGIDVAADGTVYVVEAIAKRVGHFSATGRRLGTIGPRYADPYDVQVAANGTVYVLDTAALGTIERVRPGGAASVVRG
jgi:streptogramin lyase